MQINVAMLRIPLKPVDYPRVPPRHFIAVMCGQMGIEGEIDLRPYIMLTEAENRKSREKDRTAPDFASDVGVRGALSDAQQGVVRRPFAGRR